MRIHSIHLENVKSYDNVTVHFTEGVNAIVGHNGAGKSTLLEAVGFALFGSLGYSQADFMREGTRSASVVIAFDSSADERLYHVVRNLGSSAAWYIFDPEIGSKICSGQADVLTFLRRHMGLAPGADLEQLFHDAVGVPQGTLTAAFLETPSQRKPIFDPLLQVEEYQIAFQRLLEARNLLKERVLETSAEAAHLEGLLSALPSHEQRRSELATETGRLGASLKRVQAELDAAVVLVAEQEALRADALRLSQLRDAAQTDLHSRSADLALANRRHEEAAAAHIRVVAATPGHDRYLAAQQKQIALDSQLRERQALQLRIAGLTADHQRSEESAARTEAELSAVALAESRLPQIEAAADRQQQLELHRSTAIAARAELEAERRRAAELTAQVQTDASRVAQLQQNAASAAALEAELARLRQKCATLAETNAAARDQLSALNQQADAVKEQTAKLLALSEPLCPVCEAPLTPQRRHELTERNEIEVDRLRAEYGRLRTEANAIVAELHHAEEEARSVETRLRGMPDEAAIVQAQDRLQQIAAQRAAAETRVEELNAAPATLATIESELAALGNPRSERDRLHEQAARRPALEAELTQAQQSAAAAQAELAQTTRSLAAYANLENDLEQNRNELAATIADYQTVLSDRSLSQSAPAREAEAATALDAVAAAQQALAAAESAAADALVRFDADRYNTLRANEQELRTSLGDHRGRLNALQSELANAETVIAGLRLRQTELDDLNRKRAHLSKLASHLERLRTVIKQAGPFITRALIGQISENASQNFGDLTADYTNRLRWTEEYAILLEVDGRERDFKSLSGGEQMVAALAVRLALLREMSTIDVAFFDEPTAHLDGERRDALARQIQAVKGFRQLFVISHDDTFEGATHNTVHVERRNGVSHVAS